MQLNVLRDRLTWQGLIGGDLLADVGGKLTVTANIDAFQGAYTAAGAIIVQGSGVPVVQKASSGYVGTTTNCNVMIIPDGLEAVSLPPPPPRLQLARRHSG